MLIVSFGLLMDALSVCADEEFFGCSGCLKSQLCSFIHQPRRKRKGHGIVLLEFIWALLCDCCICALELGDLLLYILTVSLHAINFYDLL